MLDALNSEVTIAASSGSTSQTPNKVFLSGYSQENFNQPGQLVSARSRVVDHMTNTRNHLARARWIGFDTEDSEGDTSKDPKTRL